MRRLATFAVLLATAVAVHAGSYEARSPQHAVAIDVVALDSGDIRYDVKVTDLATGEVLASTQLTAKPREAADTKVDVRDQHIRIHIVKESRLIASVEFEQGEDITDSIETSWSTGPHKAIMRSPDGVLRVGGDVKTPVVINRVEPAYPEDARLARVSGIVILEVLIDREGVVKKTTVLKPLPFGLDDAAVTAVKQWRFKPATLNGEPVDVLFNLTINFKLVSSPPPPPPPR